MRFASIFCALVLVACPSKDSALAPATQPIVAATPEASAVVDESADPCRFGGLRAYPPPGASATAARTVRALRDAWPAVGTRVDVVGYVAKTYACPPCPAGAECKPCMGDNVVLSDTRKVLQQYALADDDVVVFMGDPRQLKLGERHRFTVQVCAQSTTSTMRSDLALVAYEVAP